MERYRGKSVSPNIAIGRIWFYEKEKCQIEKRAISDSAAEWKRYEDARNTARDQLQELMRKIEEEVGETNAAIFDVHALLMEDADYNAYIRRYPRYFTAAGGNFDRRGSRKRILG